MSTRSDTDWFLGIDAGLTHVKTGLFDAEGTEQTVAVRSPETLEPGPTQRERDLDHLWKSICQTINDVIEDAPISGADIDCVGISGHGHGLYLLDEDGDPVRNAILSTDNRAMDVIKLWEETGLIDTISAITGYEPFGADPLSLLTWLKRNEPDTYQQIDHICFCKDYLRYRLTDAVTTDEMEASVFFDADAGDYSRNLFEEIGIEDCFDALPEIVPSWNVAGSVTDTAATQTGLVATTPVATGLHDVGATALGSGIHEAGQGLLIIGTWGQSIVIVDKQPTGVSGITRRYLNEKWLRYAGNRSAATCLEWFVDEFGESWQDEADDRNANPYTIYNEHAASIDPGADGLLFHPYLHGSTDYPRAMAGFYGLRPDHSREHLLRAVYEGVAMAQIEALNRLVEPKTLAEVRLAGGGAKSEVWSQMFADVLDTEIATVAGTEAGARGAAICAAIATDRYPTHRAAVDGMVDINRRYTPDPEAVDSYLTLRSAFLEAIDAMESVWDRLRAYDNTMEGSRD